MATTTNLGLYKPSRDDYISVTRDISDNMDIIDAAVGGNTADIGNLAKGLAYVAVKSGNNWRIPSGQTAQIGDYVYFNGRMGQATAVLTGGTTNIVEDTNWTAEEDAGSLNSLKEKVESLILEHTTSGTTNAAGTIGLMLDGSYKPLTVIGKDGTDYSTGVLYKSGSGVWYAQFYDVAANGNVTPWANKSISVTVYYLE